MVRLWVGTRLTSPRAPGKYRITRTCYLDLPYYDNRGCLVSLGGKAGLTRTVTLQSALYTLRAPLCCTGTALARATGSAPIVPGVPCGSTLSVRFLLP